MSKQNDLLKQDVKKLYFKYLIPSISATLVTSIYILADTIIIGKGIGEDAVAAINLVLPLFTLFFGTGSLFGIGGSIHMSLQRARGNEENGRSFFTTALLGNAAAMILYLLAGIIFFDQICSMLGSTQETIGYVREYGHWLIGGIPFFIFSTFLQNFIRNDHAPKLAMVSVITGGVLNIILDYIFVFFCGWGMSGAAAATTLGSMITCLILCSHFFRKTNGLKLNFHGISLNQLGKVTANGFSSFLLELATGLLSFFFNLALLRYIGVIGLTIYSIISNTALVIISLSNGVAQAAQPIITTNLGAGKYDRIQTVKRLGLMTTFVIGTISAILGMLFPELVVHIFIHPTKEILMTAPAAIRIYFTSFVLCTSNLFLSSYCQSMVHPALAMFLSMLRGIILSTLLVFLLPSIFGASVIWAVMPIVEVITFITALILIRKYIKYPQQ